MDTLESLNQKQYVASQTGANSSCSGFDKQAFAIRMFYGQAWTANQKGNTVRRDQILTWTATNF